MTPEQKAARVKAALQQLWETYPAEFRRTDARERLGQFSYYAGPTAMAALYDLIVGEPK